jgi:hypothetical protein
MGGLKGPIGRTAFSGNGQMHGLRPCAGRARGSAARGRRLAGAIPRRWSFIDPLSQHAAVPTLRPRPGCGTCGACVRSGGTILARNVRMHLSRRVAAAGAANPIDGFLTCIRTRSRPAARGVEPTAAGAIPGHAGGRTLGSARSCPAPQWQGYHQCPKTMEMRAIWSVESRRGPDQTGYAAPIRFSTEPATFHRRREM